MLDEAWAVTSEPLVCNQIEVHPFINQDKVLAASKKHGMAVVAYVPIARGKVPGADALERIGKAHGKSAAQVSLRYLVQFGLCAIPRTAKPAAPEGKSRRVRLQAVGRRDGRAEEAQRHQYARGQSAARAGVGYALIRIALALVAAVLAAAPAAAQTDKPAADDVGGDPGLRQGQDRPMDWEACIGIVSPTPASKDDEIDRRPGQRLRSTASRAVWDDILNETYRRLRAKLDDEQQTQAARDAARLDRLARQDLRLLSATITRARWRTPMVAYCVDRETGAPALFLLGFLQDAEESKG